VQKYGYNESFNSHEFSLVVVLFNFCIQKTYTKDIYKRHIQKTYTKNIYKRHIQKTYAKNIIQSQPFIKYLSGAYHGARNLPILRATSIGIFLKYLLHPPFTKPFINQLKIVSSSWYIISRLDLSLNISEIMSSDAYFNKIFCF